jgi:3',5'-cyclic AMP phosphodiesterase CpdA
MLIAQLSDCHITEPGEKACGVAPTAENLGRCVDHINRLEPEPDLVLVTGDITACGLLAEAEHAAQLLRKLRYPYYVIPGNHDDRNTLWSVFGGNACPSRLGDFFNYAVDGHEIRLLAMDSTLPGAPGGEVCEARADWLDRRLAEAPMQPTIIFTHHPPLKFGVLETDEDGFVGADRFGDVVERYSNIERIVCGHVHLLVHARWRGSVVSTAPSMGMQLSLDLTMKRRSEFLLQAPAYLLHYWNEDKNLITHSVTVADAEGPFPFD